MILTPLAGAVVFNLCQTFCKRYIIFLKGSSVMPYLIHACTFGLKDKHIAFFIRFVLNVFL